MHCLISYDLMPASGNDGKPRIGLELRTLGDWLAEYFLGAVGITVFRTISVDSGKFCC